MLQLVEPMQPMKMLLPTQLALSLACVDADLSAQTAALAEQTQQWRE